MNKRFIDLAIAILFLSVPFMTTYAAGGGGSHGNNHAALFIGATSSEPTAGIEYEYRLPFLDHMIGVGAVVERIFSDPAKMIYILGAVAHPWKASKFNISLGHERVEKSGKKAAYNLGLVRVGAGYDFHYGNWSYGPVYNLDFIDGGKTAHVLGIAVGMGF